MDLNRSAFLPSTIVPRRQRAALRLASNAICQRCASAPVRRARVTGMSSETSGSEPDPAERAESSLDWDAKWNEFRGSGMISNAPAGRDAVTPAALAAKRAADRLRTSVNDVKNRVPSRQKLFADWRFWVVVILALSLFSAYVNSTAVQPPSGTGVV